MLIGSYRISADQLSKITESLNSQLQWLTFIDTFSFGMTPDLRNALDNLVKLNWKIRTDLNKSVKVREPLKK